MAHDTGETKNFRVRDFPEEYMQKWNHLKADLGGSVTHEEALKHILDVYEEDPDAVLGKDSEIDFR